MYAPSHLPQTDPPNNTTTPTQKSAGVRLVLRAGDDVDLGKGPCHAGYSRAVHWCYCLYRWVDCELSVCKGMRVINLLRTFTVEGARAVFFQQMWLLLYHDQVSEWKRCPQ